jgi:CheY-like chemotaxis protein
MPKVLVVDDDSDLVEICSIVLEGEGYSVETACNGYEAVDKLAGDRADIMLLDVMMPALDGLSVCKIVKRDPRTKDMPVIIMSASEVLRGRGEVYADAVLAKPFDIDHLVSTVGNLVSAN